MNSADLRQAHQIFSGTSREAKLLPSVHIVTVNTEYNKYLPGEIINLTYIQHNVKHTEVIFNLWELYALCC